MVYCGKPSKGCQMCRTRRIKCDETKPICNQCTKARRQCPGYKDEFDLILRNENQAAKRRALKLSAPRRKRGNNNAERPSQPPRATINASLSSSSSSSSSLSSSSSASPPSSSSSPDPTPPPTVATRRTLSPRAHQQQSKQKPHQLVASLGPSQIHLPPEDLAPCHFVSNFVLVPRPDGTRGFLDYLAPLLASGGGPGGDNAHLRHAFNACALASLGNRPGYGSPGPAPPIGLIGAGQGAAARGILGKAFAEYSRALRTTQAALVDPQRWKSDGVLAAVLLLGMFENITAKQIGNLAWGSHVEGAIQIVKARGRSQLRTKLGLQLFIAVRTQLIIHTLTSGTPPAMGADWWIDDAILDQTAAECQRLSLKAGELRAEITRTMPSVTRTQENIKLVRGLMQRAQALDEQLTTWMHSVPEAWQYRTLCWQLHSLAVPGGSDYSKAEVFPGRVDMYSDFWVAGVWNQARTTRLVLMSMAVRCAAWVCSPVDYRTTPEYATAAKVCVDTISDILASVPYHLGWHTKRKDLLSAVESSSPASGGDEYRMKALAAYFLTWPLSCVVTQDYATDAQRAYVRGRLKYIGDAVGIKYALILSQLHFRVPSMFIRSDGLMANPHPMAHNFEKLLSSARTESPLPEGYTTAHSLRDEETLLEDDQQSQGQVGPGGIQEVQCSP